MREDNGQPSISDFSLQVLALDPNNAPAKADLAKVLPKIPKVSAPTKAAAPSETKETPKRRVRIEEIDEDESNPPLVTPSPSKPAVASKVDAPNASKQASAPSPTTQASPRRTCMVNGGALHGVMLDQPPTS